MVLGGSGLVGMAVCRVILAKNPAQLTILALKKQEVEEGLKVLKSEFPEIQIRAEFGNIFVRKALKDKSRDELLSNPKNRRTLVTDVLEDLNQDLLKEQYLFQLISEYKPQIIVDCVNTATGLAYQDVFLSGRETLKKLDMAKAENSLNEDFLDDVEKLLCTQYIPQLIRHIQILYESSRINGVKFYFKIGTSGTGGMGLNIPYTHSEERPSRVLLSKSSLAGAHSLLLFLMGRTPDAPIIKEIKPTAAIAWKKIKYGKIYRGGEPIQLYDCSFDKPVKLDGDLDLCPADRTWTKTEGKFLEAPFIDTGENGMFSRSEFQTITAIGQMGFVTPEEIAQNVLYEILGGNTGHDIINALDNASMGPTYRAGSMRHHAIEKLQQLEKEHNVDSVAFELLGPPRLSKLLYEAYMIKQTGLEFKDVIDSDPEELQEKVIELLSSDDRLRSYILSIGIPILLKDGKNFLRGEKIKIPPYRGNQKLDVTDSNIDKWAEDGWVDLRLKNFELWKERFKLILEDVAKIDSDDTSSQFEWNRQYWLEGQEDMEIGKIVGWIFVNEDKGIRMKN